MIIKEHVNIQMTWEKTIEETEEKMDYYTPECSYNYEETGADVSEKDEWEDDTEVTCISEEIPEKCGMIVPTIWKDPNIEISAFELTAFDMSVMDAVFTLQRIAKKKIVTSTLIRRTMSGNPKQTICKDMKASIEQAMLKLQKFIVLITYEKISTEKSSGTLKQKVRGSIVDFQMKNITMANGVKMTAYVLKDSVFYTYVEKMGKIVYFPMKYLKTSNIVHDSDENVLLKRYLAYRICTMYENDANQLSARVIYGRNDNGMLARIGISYENFEVASWRNKRVKIHKIVIKYLEKFKKDEWIGGYRTIQNGRRIEGVEIFK